MSEVQIQTTIDGKQRIHTEYDSLITYRAKNKTTCVLETLDILYGFS